MWKGKAANPPSRPIDWVTQTVGHWKPIGAPSLMLRETNQSPVKKIAPPVHDWTGWSTAKSLHGNLVLCRLACLPNRDASNSDGCRSVCRDSCCMSTPSTGTTLKVPDSTHRVFGQHEYLCQCLNRNYLAMTTETGEVATTFVRIRGSSLS
ncbi:hypothetical protein CLAIMM_06891 isoform 5 [Cladophialophora immunda]|nr:hypothetical protein CLAIMM_06891 isoform 2 [Cladophialophora immunda]OQV01557.1 hypothetical protein CLAIMM_06891 isoform 5 [Cladophialophora immunda]